jgi:hypothetical protein
MCYTGITVSFSSRFVVNSDVDAVGKKKSKISKLMGKKQECKLAIKTGTMGKWTLVFADAFPVRFKNRMPNEMCGLKQLLV